VRIDEVVLAFVDSKPICDLANSSSSMCCINLDLNTRVLADEIILDKIYVDVPGSRCAGIDVPILAAGVAASIL
jgi:hypothetical protein